MSKILYHWLLLLHAFYFCEACIYIYMCCIFSRSSLSLRSCIGTEILLLAWAYMARTRNSSISIQHTTKSTPNTPQWCSTFPVNKNRARLCCSTFSLDNTAYNKIHSKCSSVVLDHLWAEHVTNISQMSDQQFMNYWRKKSSKTVLLDFFCE